MNWDGGPVLVTGAGGFIGSHLTEALVAKGVPVRAFLHYNSRADRGQLEWAPSETLAQVEVVFGDLRDADTLRRAARGVSAVFHLGALIGIPYSYASPRDVVDTNVTGTLNVLEAVRDAEVGRLLVISTSEVYGTAQYIPIDEAHVLQGQSPYSASKIGAEKLAESYWRSFEVPLTVVRPFNTFGPRQSTRAVIPTVITQALSGGTLHLGSLTPTRDFTFVTDTAAAMIAIGACPGTVGEVVNIGTGTDISIADLVALVSELTGRALEVATDDQRLRPAASEVERLQADAGKLTELTGWRPALTFRDGLQLTIDWIGANLSRFRPATYGV